jgi:hypothetical protein
MNFPSFASSSDCAAILAESDAAFAEAVAGAKASVAASEARVAELDAMIDAMSTARLSADTTVEDVYAMYPEIGEEIEQELGEQDWRKDTI